MKKIAIIGSGCLLPGYTTKEQLWDRMINGECFLTEEKFDERLIERGHLSKKDSNHFFKNHLSKDQLDQLNHKGEIYKWSTYVVQEALKESGYLDDKVALSKCGIIMGTLGMFVPEYISMFDSLVKVKIENNINTLLDDSSYVFTNREYDERIHKDKCYVDTDNLHTIVDFFHLGKVNLSMSAACSTPLYAIKLACMYLESERADMMVVGSNCENESKSDVCGIFDLLSILTEKGHCNPLNKNSEGLIISSGAGAVVLKRLKDAVRDEDRILAVIDNIGWSNDGSAKSLLAPCMDGQVASYQDAYRDGVKDDIDYIECHSTGTTAGDMEEYNSIYSYFYDRGKNPLIGTLKGNTGHFLTSSAMGSLIKVILSMQHDMIPKTIRVNEPISKKVVTENTPWPRTNREKRAAVNAFGFGGINAHLVLSEYRKEASDEGKKINTQDEAIVVTGMDIQIGRLKNKEELFETLLTGETVIEDEVRNRFSQDNKNKKILSTLGISKFPKGAYIHEIPFDFMKFKITAKNNMHYVRRDLLLLNVANRALVEANITVGSHEDTAVIVNAGQDFAVLNYRASEELYDQIMESFALSTPGLSDLQKQEILDIVRKDEQSAESSESIVGIIPSIRGSRISYHWNFKGPSFVLTEQEAALVHSLELAKMLFEKHVVKNVVIGTVELLGETEFLYAEKLNGNLDQIIKYGIGEGAAVLVLKTKDEAMKCNDQIYGRVESDLVHPSNEYQQLLKEATGYSVSLSYYMELIVHMMESFYQCSIPRNKTKESQGDITSILQKLQQNAEENDRKVLDDTKLSFIKTVPTSLPAVAERDSFKDHIHSFQQALTYKKALVHEKDHRIVNKINSRTFTTDLNDFIYTLQQEDQRVATLLHSIEQKHTSTIWNREQIVEMTNGSMSKILGSQYEKLDQYPVRSRMPSPPYLFVSRITKIDARHGELRPSSIEIEYDIEEDCIYLQGDHTIANVVYTEASHIGIFLGSYIGIDITKDQALRFRVVDSKITFKSNKPVRIGDTLRLSYQIRKFLKRGDSMIVFSGYEVYIGKTMLLSTEAIGGFFLEEDLKVSKGIISPRIKFAKTREKKHYSVKRQRMKQQYSSQEMEQYFDGRLRDLFGDASMYNDPRHYINPKVRMLDAVTEINCMGGNYGLGYIKGEKRIDESHWGFKAHFKNDPVFPGTLILNGANQLYLFWALYYGFYNGDINRKPQIIEGITVDVAFRGQVRPEPSTIYYEIHIKEVQDELTVNVIIADVDVYWKGINVIREKNISLRFL